MLAIPLSLASSPHDACSSHLSSRLWCSF